MGTGSTKDQSTTVDDLQQNCQESCTIICNQTQGKCDSQHKIYFYDVPSERVKAEYVFLNNFSETPFTIDGIVYKTVEHYYQAEKFVGDENAVKFRMEVINSKDADQAKKLARDFESQWGDAEWWKTWHEERKLTAMRKAIKAKFEQNPALADQLIATGNRCLIEDSPKDYYWGGALAGSLNMLGNLLMERRYLLREKNKQKAVTNMILSLEQQES